MPLKDKQRRAEYAKRYRDANKKRLHQKQFEYWQRPGNKERGRLRKQLWLGLPEPTRPRPERCECCNRPPEKKRTLHLDHDHKTGAFRGWLCHHCNTGIGLLGDDALGVRFALAYLSLNG